jgi:hypothetical protein
VRKNEETYKPDSLDILSSIWILSCNDENAIITYQDLNYRLNPPSDIDLRKLVQARAELFRTGVARHRLDRWKQKMLAGDRLPSYLHDLEDAERKREIESIGQDDVFRNQFRAGPAAPSAQIEVLDWGLQHIDRMRKARSETREQKLKELSGKWLPLLSTAVALVAILSTGFFQKQNMDTQARLKYYEVELKPKQESYDGFMKSLIDAGDNARKNDHTALVHDVTEMELAYYKLEGFLAENNRENRDIIWKKFQDFSALCFNRVDQKDDSAEFIESLTEYKKEFRYLLTHTLFPDSYQ